MKQAICGMLCLTLLASCTGPRPAPDPPIDEDLERLTRGAWRAFEQGDMERARSIYERALERSKAVDAPAEIGNAAYNLAVTLIAAGEYERAGELLREAERELARAGGNIVDVLLVQARLAQLDGRDEDALRLANRAATGPGSMPEQSHWAQIELLRGEMAAAHGELSAAAAALERARQFAGEEPDTTLHARLQGLTGRVQLLQNHPRAAAASFDLEARLWRKANHLRDMVDALARSAEAWHRAGDLALSAERYFRAARSSWAQGEERQALQWSRRADEYATRSGARALMKRARDLRMEIEAAIEPERAARREAGGKATPQFEITIPANSLAIADKLN
jgi:tetratricopeptide (TPR) repeat protein